MQYYCRNIKQKPIYAMFVVEMTLLLLEVGNLRAYTGLRYKSVSAWGLIYERRQFNNITFTKKSFRPC